MKRTKFTLGILIALSSVLSGQTSPKDKGLQSITMDAVRGQLEFLSSDWMEGRGTGEKGSYLAADYMASMFRVFGVSPGGDAGSMGRGGRTGGRPSGMQGRSGPSRSYFQDFTLIETLPGGTASMTIKKGSVEYVFSQSVDFTLSRLSLSTRFSAPVVFVGYGIVDKSKGIDDFAGVDVRGKVILRLSGFPGENDISSPMYKKLVGDNPRAASELTRNKNAVISDLGVAGVIDLTFDTDAGKPWGEYKFDYNLSPAESSRPSDWYPMSLDGREIPSAPVSITVTERVKSLLLKDSGIDIAKYQKDAASGTLRFKPVVIPGLNISIDASTNTRRVNVRNVIAMIEGENPEEIVAIGAHMDHMGIDNGRIWNGADDNASGTVAVMTIAKAFAESGVKPKKTIVFCAWTGEEKGLLGSEYFNMYPSIGKLSDYKLYINYDMIGMDATNDSLRNKKTITYTTGYPRLEEVTRLNRDKYSINLDITYRTNESPTGGSDYASFSENKIPVIAWESTLHPDYHQPSDHANILNWEKVLNIIKLGYLQLWDIANGEIK